MGIAHEETASDTAETCSKFKSMRQALLRVHILLGFVWKHMLAVEHIRFYGSSASSNRVSGSWYAPSDPSPAGNADSRTSVTVAKESRKRISAAVAPVTSFSAAAPAPQCCMLRPCAAFRLTCVGALCAWQKTGPLLEPRRIFSKAVHRRPRDPWPVTAIPNEAMRPQPGAWHRRLRTSTCQGSRCCAQKRATPSSGSPKLGCRWHTLSDTDTGALPSRAAAPSSASRAGLSRVPWPVDCRNWHRLCRRSTKPDRRCREHTIGAKPSSPCVARLSQPSTTHTCLRRSTAFSGRWAAHHVAHARRERGDACRWSTAATMLLPAIAPAVSIRLIAGAWVASALHVGKMHLAPAAVTRGLSLCVAHTRSPEPSARR